MSLFIKVNGYVCRGSNSAVFIFASVINNYNFFDRVEEYWEPKVEGLERLVFGL